MEIISSNAFCSAKFDSENRLVYYQYVGVVNPSLGLLTLRAVMKFAVSYKIKGIVSDISRMKGTFTSVNDFFEQEYYPHMIKHGLICTGIVLSTDIFTKFAAQDLMKKVAHFRLQMFGDFAQAERWVKETVTMTDAKL